MCFIDLFFFGNQCVLLINEAYSHAFPSKFGILAQTEKEKKEEEKVGFGSKKRVTEIGYRRKECRSITNQK